MTTEKLQEFFESKDFSVHLDEQDGVQCAEVETWTEGGVNMIPFLNPFTIEEFESHVNDFNVDGEIDLHREGERYRNNFTIKQSLKDFEKYHKRIKSVLKELKKLQQGTK